MPERIKPTLTIQAFFDRLERFRKENRGEGGKLYEELVERASHGTYAERTLEEIITSQIDFNIAERKSAGEEITVEKYIDGLFSPNPDGEISADIIIGRLFPA